MYFLFYEWNSKIKVSQNKQNQVGLYRIPVKFCFKGFSTE